MKKEIILEKISYSELNAKQQENYNYQKVSAVLADYGFNTLRLSDDWQGADFIAIHINGEDFLKVQLKSRLTFDKKYIGRSIWICFPYQGSWFLYEHDELLQVFGDKMNFTNTGSWQNWNSYSSGYLSKEKLSILEKHKI